eukprot:PhM_4_TR2030/c0_g2_i1/m.34447
MSAEFSNADSLTQVLNALAEPTIYAFGGVAGTMIATQAYPNLFTPPEYRGKLLFNNKAQRLLLPPLAFCGVGFAVAGSLITERDEPVRGHMLSFISSLGMVAWALPGRNITHWYSIIASLYFAFGYNYSYKNVMILTDNAPWYKPGDWEELKTTLGW